MLYVCHLLDGHMTKRNRLMQSTNVKRNKKKKEFAHKNLMFIVSDGVLVTFMYLTGGEARAAGGGTPPSRTVETSVVHQLTELLLVPPT